MSNLMKKIEYQYFNLDSGKYCESYEELAKQVGRGGFVSCKFPRNEGPVLVVGGRDRNYEDLQ